MSMKFKLSIIVPVFNGAKYIERCLNSLLNQSLKDIQIIVVDDGSIDNTCQIIQQYINQAVSITLLQHKRNMGTGMARNSGLQQAIGEYVAFMDADDWMDMNGYLELTTALDTSGAEIGLCNVCTEIGSYHFSTARYSYLHRNIINGMFGLHLLCKMDAQESYIGPRVGNKVFRRSFLEENNLRFPSYPFWEDDMFTFMAMYHAKHIVVVPEVSEHYYQRETSAMHSFSTTHIQCFVAVFSELKEKLSTPAGNIICEDEFYAFLDRGLNVLLDSLFTNEPHVSNQRKYLCLIVDQLLNTFTFQELIEHIEPQRIMRIWL